MYAALKQTWRENTCDRYSTSVIGKHPFFRVAHSKAIGTRSITGVKIIFGYHFFSIEISNARLPWNGQVLVKSTNYQRDIAERFWFRTSLGSQIITMFLHFFPQSGSIADRTHAFASLNMSGSNQNMSNWRHFEIGNRRRGVATILTSRKNWCPAARQESVSICNIRDATQVFQWLIFGKWGCAPRMFAMMALS